MCLTTMTRGKPKATGFGWKVFRIWPRELEPKLYGAIYSPRKARPIGEWLDGWDYRDPPGSPNFTVMIDYPAGWHIFKKKKDAIAWAPINDHSVRKVEYKKAHAKGKQAGLNCIVAKEIKILPLKGE